MVAYALDHLSQWLTQGAVGGYALLMTWTAIDLWRGR